MKIFRIDDQYSVVCEYQNTRSGFRHLATLCINGTGFLEVKCTYLNRTWERYTYESVLKKMLEKCRKEQTLDEIALKLFDEAIERGA